MSFEKEVEIAIDGMGKDARRFVTAVNLEAWRSIIRQTPVDTGRLRGNWQTTENTPAAGTTGAIQKGNGGPATQQAEATLFKGFGLFWLSNNLPYAPVVEYGLYGKGPGATDKTGGTGFSVQAPSGMVRKTASRLRQILRKHAK